MNTKEYSDIVRFLSIQEFPLYIQQSKDQNKCYLKRNFRIKAYKYEICECKLFKIMKGKEDKLYQVVQENEVAEILHIHHDAAGHPGMNMTIMSIREKYYWCGLSRDVKDYIKSCHTCQMTATLPPQPQKKLQPIPPPDQPWTHIGIDLICDFPKNIQGFKHILVTTCYLTKFTAARPLRTKTTKEVLNQLEDIYLALGFPKIIQHDQGPEFTSKEFSEFHQCLLIDNRATAAYQWPQSNGLVEAHNKILKTKLNKMMFNSDIEWPDMLKQALLAINTCWKRSTRYTPFYLMYGRDANNLHFLKFRNFEYQNDFQAENDSFEVDTSQIMPVDLSESVVYLNEKKMAIEQAQENLQREQLVQKCTFDAKVKKNRSEINTGDLILYRNMPKFKKLPGTKDQHKYIGPTTAHQVTDTHVILNNFKKSKSKRVPLNISRLYHPRSDLNQMKQKKTIADMPLKKIKTIKITKSPEQSVMWVFGIEKQTVIDELNIFKTIFSEYMRKGEYLSELHAELELESNKKGYYLPDTLLYDVLKDTTVESMRREILNILLEYPKKLFPEIGASRSADYVCKVLYGVAMEFIGNKLIDAPLDESLYDLFHLSSDDPKISFPTIEWKKDKCNVLQIPYKTEIEQHTTLNGEKLKCFQPCTCDDIKADGNCMFRCFSKILTGSEEHHLKLRGEICRYMITQGQDTMGWYFCQIRSNTPAQYLRTSGMLMDSIWGGDVELMAFSSLLNTDIYVANRFYKTNDSVVAEIRWSRIRASNDNCTKNCIYISNFSHHYEPVCKMMNSISLTYFASEDKKTILDLKYASEFS